MNTSARVDAHHSVSKSVIASDSVFAFELHHLSEFHEIKASQASEKVKPEPVESHKFSFFVKRKSVAGFLG